MSVNCPVYPVRPGPGGKRVCHTTYVKGELFYCKAWFGHSQMFACFAHSSVLFIGVGVGVCKYNSR